MTIKSYDRLGELQKAVLEAVWQLDEATVQQVRDHLKRRKKPAYTTVLTAMQKLEKAGWLKHRADGRMYVYRPARTREQASATSLRKFTSRVFGGDPLLLFQHLLDDDRLTADELAGLKKMIEAKRQELDDV